MVQFWEPYFNYSETVSYLRGMLLKSWAFIRFLRLPNLLLVFLTQAIPYWCVLRPAIARSGGIAVLSEYTFLLLGLATVLTTLAGYVINDYFDRDIDAINRPDSVVVGRFIAPDVALAIYWVLQLSITFLSVELHFSIPSPHGWWALWVFPVVSLLLFLYAWQLKCTPFMGNILVALLCGVTPLLMLIPENRPLWLSSFQFPEEIRRSTAIVWMYGLFALATNLYREQIKDLEDFQGDASCGCHTIAVLRGIRFAKKNAGVTGFAVCLLLLFLMVFWQERLHQDWRIVLGVIFLLFPAVVSVFLVFSAKEKKHFTYSSRMLKIVMLSGIFLLLPYWPLTQEEWWMQWELLTRWIKVI
jgi:4-hydroxybenzoate polyprenyltransferase